MKRTVAQDIVLVYLEDKPAFFARVEDINADHKPGWYHIKLLALQVPVQVITWILRDTYIDGGEFTMNGKRMRLEKVVNPDIPDETSRKVSGKRGKKEIPGTRDTASGGKVISLTDRKK